MVQNHGFFAFPSAKINKKIRLVLLRFRLSITKSIHNQNYSYLYHKTVASVIITTFISLLIVVLLRLVGHYLNLQTDLPALAAANPNRIDTTSLHRLIKIGLYCFIFVIAFRNNLQSKPGGNIILFFGTLFYLVYFSIISLTFVRNLPREIHILRTYPDPALSNINYFHYQSYCAAKNKSFIYLCEPSLICQSHYYECLYGCQARCQPKIPNPMIPTPGHFKIVRYN